MEQPPSHTGATRVAQVRSDRPGLGGRVTAWNSLSARAGEIHLQRWR